MKYLNNIYLKLIFTITTICFSQNFNNEKLFYDIKFRIFSAGHATFESKTDSLDQQEVLKIILKTKSNKFLDKFYKIRDDVKIWVNKQNYSLLKVNKKIHEGSYKRTFSSIIDEKKSIAIYNEKVLKIPKEIFDPLGAIYYYRTLNLSNKKVYNFFTFDEGKINEVLLKVIGLEYLKTPLGKMQCFILQPSSIDGKKLFKNNGQMKIWISNDEKKLPVKIEQNTNIGKLILNLTKVSNN